MKNKFKSNISFGLPPDHREQKTREQNAYLEKCRENPALGRSAMAFLGIKDEIIEVSDPSLIPDEVRYNYS